MIRRNRHNPHLLHLGPVPVLLDRLNIALATGGAAPITTGLILMLN